MNEAGVWQTLKKGMMCSGWHVTRIESSAGNGVPDVSYGIPGINGFIELKYIAKWPVKATTKVKLPLRPEQKHWIKARGSIAGNVWVFVRIEDTFFLLTYTEALEAVEGWTAQEWIGTCVYWHKKINFEEFCAAIKGGC